MLFTVAEMDVLRLCAWCKDLPIGSHWMDQNLVRLHKQLGYFRESRSGQSIRLTPLGYELLQQAGYEYPLDRQYRGKGDVLTRRLHMAGLVLLCYRLGADVFAAQPPANPSQPVFLPSFALRRKQASNLLGGSSLGGFLYAGQSALVFYYLDQNNKGIHPMAEERVFTASGLRRGKSPSAVYTGQRTLSGLIGAARSRNATAKLTTSSYWDAMLDFHCPVCFVPDSEYGLRQLRILCLEEGRQKMAGSLFGGGFCPDIACDVRHPQTKEPYIIGIDCDIRRFLRAAQSAGPETIHIVVLDQYLQCIRQILRGANAVLHPFTMDAAEELLGIPHSLPSAVPSPFLTKGGDYLCAPVIQIAGKTGAERRSAISKE